MGLLIKRNMGRKSCHFKRASYELENVFSQKFSWEQSCPASSPALSVGVPPPCPCLARSYHPGRRCFCSQSFVNLETCSTRRPVVTSLRKTNAQGSITSRQSIRASCSRHLSCKFFISLFLLFVKL